MKEQLQSIIDQKVTGSDAVQILRSAIEEHGSVSAQSLELGQLIGQAEDVLLYSKEGRPVHRTYR